MGKAKYIALLAVIAMVVSVITVMSLTIGGKMHPPDGETHPVHQTDYSPVIDGIVDVPSTWPVESHIGFMYVTGKPASTAVADVYVLLDNLGDPGDWVNPASYDAEDWTGYYLYIGIKALAGYTIENSNEVLIDWDQDGIIDFADHNGNSQNPGQGGYDMTQFAHTSQGTEWAVPYMDDFTNGICQSPFDIYVHCDVSGGGYSMETATFPDRPPGPKLSTTFCVGSGISPEEPEPGEWGIRTIGFWKHQFNVALGNHKGHQHVPQENLLFYLSEISSDSSIPELQDMDTDMMAALALLELRGKHAMYDRAVQQLLAVWLNYVSGNENATLGNTTYHLYDDVIVPGEAALLDGDPANDAFWKDFFDDINNSEEP